MTEKKCVTCGRAYDTFTGLQSEAPKQFDYCVCLYCGAICWFNKELNLEPIPPNELDLLAEEAPHVYSLLIEAQKFIHEQG